MNTSSNLLSIVKNILIAIRIATKRPVISSNSPTVSILLTQAFVILRLAEAPEDVGVHHDTGLPE